LSIFVDQECRIMKKLVSIIIIVFYSQFIFAQGFAFGFKTGITTAFQKWASYSARSPLLNPTGNIYIESISEENKNALFVQAGYHIKGSQITNRFGGNTKGSIDKRKFKFHNISLMAGAKQKKDWGDAKKAYYGIGFRGEFTHKTNLEDYVELNKQFPIYPHDGAVKRLTYGFTLSGGLEMPITELIGGVFEISVNPDFGQQYFQPADPRPYTDAWGREFYIRENKIVNITIEVTLGMRFLYKVIYVD